MGGCGWHVMDQLDRQITSCHLVSFSLFSSTNVAGARKSPVK
jgi:hypothetical protein